MKTKANPQNASQQGQGRQKQPANEPHVRKGDAPSHHGRTVSSAHHAQPSAEHVRRSRQCLSSGADLSKAAEPEPSKIQGGKPHRGEPPGTHKAHKG